MDWLGVFWNRTRSNKTPLARMIVAILFISLTTTVRATATDHDRIVDRISYRQAVYVWSDDSQALTEFLFESLATLIPDESLEERPSAETVFSWVDDLHAELKKQAPTARHVVQVAAGVEVLQSLHAGLIDGDCMFVRMPDGEWVIIARTSGEAEEVSAFAQNMSLVFDAEKAERAAKAQRDGANADAEGAESSLSWRHVSHWLVLASDDSSLDAYCTDLEDGAKHSLSDERVFQRVVANQQTAMDRYAHVNLFVTPQCVSEILEDLQLVRSFKGYKIPDVWKRFADTFEPTSIRAVGGRVLLPSRQLQEDSNVEAAMDLFAVIAEPRGGPLKLVSYRNGIDFDLPELNEPLQSFVQAEIVSDEVHAEVTALLQQGKQFIPKSTSGPARYWVALTESFDPFPKELADITHGVSLMTTRSGIIQARFASAMRVHCWTFLKGSRGVLADRLVDQALRADPSDKWVKATTNGSTVWKLSDASINAHVKPRAEKLEMNWQRLVDELKKNDNQKSKVSQTISEWKAREDRALADFEAQLRRKAFLQVGNWYSPFAIENQHDNQQHGDQQHGDQQHGEVAAENRLRLKQLEADLESLEMFFATKACAICAIWDDELRTQLRIPLEERYPSGLMQEMKEWKATAVSNPTDPSLAGEMQMRSKLSGAKRQLSDRLRSMVITLEDHPGGFRVVVALVRNPANDDVLSKDTTQ